MIKIHTQAVKHLSTSLSKDISRLANVENEISSLNHQLDWRIKERGNLHQRIDRSSRSVKELEARVRALENMIQGSMNRYEQAEDSLVREANRIGQIETITTGDGNATNPFLKSLNSFKEIGQELWSEMKNRNEKKFDSWYDFGNYLSLGVFDSTQALYEGMRYRWGVATNSSYDFINYLSMGGFDTVKGTFNPEEAYSKEHWLNSMGVFGYFVGMGTLMKSWNSTRLGMNRGKVGQTDANKGVRGAGSKLNNLAEANIWGMENYKQWRNNLTPNEIKAINDYTDIFHYGNMNNYLRGISDNLNSGNLERINSLTSALEKAKLPEDMILYRGTSKEMIADLINVKNPNFKDLIGKTIEEKGFMSTSLLESEKFSGDLSLIINAPRNSQGAYLGHFSQNPKEAEILFNKGQKMVIREVNENNGNLIIVVDLSID